MIEFKNATFTYPETEKPVFENLTLTLPDGIVSCIGQNGTGKSTLLLLASGRLLPDTGDVFIDGVDTKTFKTEEDRAKYAAYIYQNMEFETEEPIGDLLTYVFENGFHTTKDLIFVDQLVEVFELENFLSKKTQQLSKGELQRTILAFSLLYGSTNIFMDEPIFALEDYQKKQALEFLTSYAKKDSYSLYYSLHELDLSEKYSETIVLFSKKTEPRVGPAKELFQKEIIEEAYEVPFDMLKKRESLFRDSLIQLDTMRQKEAPPEEEQPEDYV
ncbi:MAG: ABC transporter ATP-binding protein [Spirochaetales bacterium]|nr:ABC transporter ATP-binding protein [Spirochaetales bacterium]